MNTEVDGYFANNHRNIPGIHPGLQDLIRVLGKQAHSASRTMILCEPFVATNRERKYHKNCRPLNKPQATKSWDNVNRPTALWSPIRLDNYYYDCYYYRQYPERDADYRNIEEKYMAIKEKPLDYSVPLCPGKSSKVALLGEYEKHKRHTAALLQRGKSPPQRAGSYVSANLSHVEDILGVDLHSFDSGLHSYESSMNRSSQQQRRGLDGPRNSARDGVGGNDEKVRLQEYNYDYNKKLKEKVKLNEYVFDEDSDCVPYNDLEKLKNFKEARSRDVSSTLSTVEVLATTLKKKLHEISNVFERTHHQIEPPEHRMKDARSETFAALGEILNLIHSNDDTLVKRLIGLRNSSLEMNDYLKRWQQGAREDKRGSYRGEDQGVKRHSNNKRDIPEMSSKDENSGTDLLHRNWKQDTSLENVPSEPRSTNRGESSMYSHPTGSDRYGPLTNYGIGDKSPGTRRTVEPGLDSVEHTYPRSTHITTPTKGKNEEGTPLSRRRRTTRYHRGESTSEEDSLDAIPGTGSRKLAEIKPYDALSTDGTQLQDSHGGPHEKPIGKNRTTSYDLQSTPGGGSRVKILDDDSMSDPALLTPSGSGILKNSAIEKFGNKNVVVNIGEYIVTIQQVVEVTNLVTDVIIMEVITEMMSNNLYFPPTRRNSRNATQALKEDKEPLLGSDHSKLKPSSQTSQKNRPELAGNIISPQSSSQSISRSSVLRNQRNPQRSRSPKISVSRRTSLRIGPDRHMPGNLETRNSDMLEGVPDVFAGSADQLRRSYEKLEHTISKVLPGMEKQLSSRKSDVRKQQHPGSDRDASVKSETRKMEESQEHNKSVQKGQVVKKRNSTRNSKDQRNSASSQASIVMVKEESSLTISYEAPSPKMNSDPSDFQGHTDVIAGPRNEIESHQLPGVSNIDQRKSDDRHQNLPRRSRPINEPLATPKQRISLGDQYDQYGQRSELTRSRRKPSEEERNSSRKPDPRELQLLTRRRTEAKTNLKNIVEPHRQSQTSSWKSAHGSFEQEDRVFRSFGNTRTTDEQHSTSQKDQYSQRQSEQYMAGPRQPFESVQPANESAFGEYHEEETATYISRDKRQRKESFKPVHRGDFPFLESKKRRHSKDEQSADTSARGELQQKNQFAAAQKPDLRKRQPSSGKTPLYQQHQRKRYDSKFEGRESFHEGSNTDLMPTDGSSGQKHSAHHEEDGRVEGDANQLREFYDPLLRKNEYPPRKLPTKYTQGAATEVMPEEKSLQPPISSNKNKTDSPREAKPRISRHETNISQHTPVFGSSEYQQDQVSLDRQVMKGGQREPTVRGSTSNVDPHNRVPLSNQQPLTATETKTKVHRRSRSLSPSFTLCTGRHVTCRLDEERLNKQLLKTPESYKSVESYHSMDMPPLQRWSEFQKTTSQNARLSQPRSPCESRDRNATAVRPSRAVLSGKKENSTIFSEHKANRSVLFFARLSENAFPPTRENLRAPGFMLKSAYDYLISARGMVIVKTDLRVELPPNCYGRIAPIRCLAENYGIGIGSDVIGQDDDITVLLFNHSDKPFRINRGNKVPQLLCESIHCSDVRENCKLLK